MSVELKVNGPDQNNKAILVAGNDVFFYTKSRAALLPRGYRLERTRTQQEVMEKATALGPAAIILNMNDETLDAFRALEQIKGDDRLRTIPVLAFANHEEVETWKRAKELGITKIVSRNEFSSRTRDLVEELLSEQPTARS